MQHIDIRIFMDMLGRRGANAGEYEHRLTIDIYQKNKIFVFFFFKKKKIFFFWIFWKKKILFSSPTPPREIEDWAKGAIPHPGSRPLRGNAMGCKCF